MEMKADHESKCFVFVDIGIHVSLCISRGGPRLDDIPLSAPAHNFELMECMFRAYGNES
jgi:hypothetical protein